MSELDNFLGWVKSRQRDAEVAIHNGDEGPRLATWSHNEPVSVLGAWFSATGWDEVDRMFHRLAASFSGCASYEYDIVAAEVSGDLAYTVGYEHTSATVDGEPRQYTLRVTNVYRREDGDWKVVHRHAEPPPNGSSG
ncbi:MAG TPA: nuclear transport factor 2 family protein [Micromonosporaceae bacterium]